MSRYPRKPYDCGNDCSVLQPGRTAGQLIKQLGRIVDVKSVVDRTHDEELELGA